MLRRSTSLLPRLSAVARPRPILPRRGIITSLYPDVQIPSTSFNDHVLANVDKFKDQVALVDGVTGDALKYSEVKAAVHRVASALTRRGFRKGDVLTLFVHNCSEAVLIYHGVLAVGGVVNFASRWAKVPDVVRQLQNCRSRLLVVTAPEAPIAIQAAGQVSHVEDIFVIGGTPGHACRSASELIEADDGGASPWGQVEIGPDDVALLPHTGGTTGPPKTVMLTNRNLVANMAQVESIYDLKPGAESFLEVVPFTNLYSTTCIYAHGFNKGAKIVSLPRFNRELFLQTIERHRSSMLHIVSPILLFLLQSPLTEQYNLTSVRRFYTGSPPRNKEIYEAFVKKFMVKRPDVDLFQGYGQTETSPFVTLRPRRELLKQPKYDSVGHLLPNTDCRILKVDSMEEVDDGEEGEIVVRGPQVMKGYLGAPEETSEPIRGGWYFTGDIGKIDEDGFFYLYGRKEELIKYKDFHVAPAEVESVLLTHPNVVDCVVVGKPDAQAGELPTAFVVKKGSVDGQQLQDFIAEQLNDKKQLRGGVVFIDEIPKLAGGVIHRNALKEQLKE